MAYIAVSVITANEISIYVDGLDVNYSLYDRQAYWTIGPDTATIYQTGQSSIPAYVSSGGAMTFFGLSPSTTYCIGCDISTSMGFVGLGYIYCTTSSARPPYYYWTYSKVSGGYFNLTASEWNGLTNNINLVRQYKGYSTYWFSTAYTGSQFTAIHWNEAVNAIQGIFGYGYWLSTHSSGDVIYASEMNTMINELNAIP